MADLTKTDRPEVLGGVTVKVTTGCGNMYVQLNFHHGRVFEIFATLGQGGGCAAAQSQALTKCITLGLKYGVPVDEYAKYLRSIRCPNPVPWPRERAVMSCPDGIAWAIRKYGGIAGEDVARLVSSPGSLGGAGDVEDGGIPAAVEEARKAALTREEQGIRDVGPAGLPWVLGDCPEPPAIDNYPGSIVLESSD